MSLRTKDIRHLSELELIEIIGDEFNAELQHLRRATPSAESIGLAPGDRHDSPSYRLYGEDDAEVNRTMLSILALKWILIGDYESLTEAQAGPIKLGRNSFFQMSTFFKQCLPTLNDVYLLIVATIVADVGKDPGLAGEIEAQSGSKVNGNHDFLVYEAAKLDLLPCLTVGNLESSDRQDIMLGLKFAANFNIPQLAQAENVPGSLKAVSSFKSRSRAIQLKVMEVFLDVAGAAAQKSLKGSLTMTEDVYHTYMTAIGALTEFIHEPIITETQCYNKILKAKSDTLACTGFGKTLRTERPSDRALLRLLCMGRVSTVKMAHHYQAAFNQLGDLHHDSVTRLNATGLTEDDPAIIPYYAPALFARIMTIWHDQVEQQQNGQQWLVSALSYTMRLLSTVCKPSTSGTETSSTTFVQERNLDFALQKLANPGDHEDILDRLSSLVVDVQSR